MTTIPGYPAPLRALDGSELIAGWQDGKQRAIPTKQVADLAASLAAAAAGAAATTAAAFAAVSRTLIDAAVAQASFTPRALFATGGKGVWFDPTDRASLYADRAGTLPAVVGGPVGRMLDKSGNDLHWTAVSDAARPVLVIDDNERTALRFDGVDDVGETPAFAYIDVAGRFASFVAIAADDVDASQMIVSGAPLTFGTLAQFELGVVSGSVQGRSFDNTSAPVIGTDDPIARLSPGVAFVAGVTSDAAMVSTFRNGSTRRGAVFKNPSRVAPPRALGIGARANAALWFKGLFYGSVHVARPLSDREIEQLNRFLANRGGVAVADVRLLPYFAADGCNQPWITSCITSPPVVYTPAIGQTWVANEAWNALTRLREFRVNVYDHGAERWTGPFVAGIGALHDDDHGPPAIVRDADGFWHLFGGAHVMAMQHFRTARPDDPSRWIEQPAIEGAYTYPHPVVVGGVLYLFMRRTVEGVKMPFGFTKLDGTAWSPFVDVCDFGANSRNYGYRTTVVGTKVALAFTRANYADTSRKGVYFLRYDTATGATVNLSGDHETAAAQLPINAGAAAAFYQLQADGPDTVVAMEYAWDLIDPSVLHLVFVDAGQWKYRRYANGVPAGLDVVLAGALGARDVATLVATEASEVQFYYVEPVAGLIGPQGDAGPVVGNIRRVVRNSAGEWGPDQTLQRARNYGLGCLFGLAPGTADCRVVWGESVPSVQDFPEQGHLRLFAHGDDGPLGRDHVGAVRATVASDAPLLPSFPVGGRIGVVESISPFGRPIQRQQRIVSGGDAVALVDGYLVRRATMTANQLVTIRSIDFDGREADNIVAVPFVAADSPFAFTNAEAQAYVGRTGIYWSPARKAAIDAFVSALKAAGVWAQLDVLVPPSVPQVAAALLNLRQAAFDATITMPVMFAPGTGFRTNGGFIDTGFNPVAATGRFSRDSASIGTFVVEADEASANILGWYDGADGTLLNCAAISGGSGGAVSARVNQAALSAAGPSTGFVYDAYRHLIAANRSGATSIELYNDGTTRPVTTNPGAPSTKMNDARFLIGRPVAGQSSSATVNGWFIGGSMSAAQHAALAAAWAALMAAMA